MHFSCNIDVRNPAFISNGYLAAPERNEDPGLDEIFNTVSRRTGFEDEAPNLRTYTYWTYQKDHFYHIYIEK